MRLKNDKVQKLEKVTKITRTISKPYAYLQTMEKTCASLKKKIGIKLNDMLREQGTHSLYTSIQSEAEKKKRVKGDKN